MLFFSSTIESTIDGEPDTMPLSSQDPGSSSVQECLDWVSSSANALRARISVFCQFDEVEPSDAISPIDKYADDLPPVVDPLETLRSMGLPSELADPAARCYIEAACKFREQVNAIINDIRRERFARERLVYIEGLLSLSSFVQQCVEIYQGIYRRKLLDMQDILMKRVTHWLESQTTATRGITETAVRILEVAYGCRQNNLNAAEKAFLAQKTGLTERQVLVWFQNRRQRGRSHTLAARSVSKKRRTSKTNDKHVDQTEYNTSLNWNDYDDCDMSQPLTSSYGELSSPNEDIQSGAHTSTTPSLAASRTSLGSDSSFSDDVDLNLVATGPLIDEDEPMFDDSDYAPRNLVAPSFGPDVWRASASEPQMLLPLFGGSCPTRPDMPMHAFSEYLDNAFNGDPESVEPNGFDQLFRDFMQGNAATQSAVPLDESMDEEMLPMQDIDNDQADLAFFSTLFGPSNQTQGDATANDLPNLSDNALCLLQEDFSVPLSSNQGSTRDVTPLSTHSHVSPLPGTPIDTSQALFTIADIERFHAGSFSVNLVIVVVPGQPGQPTRTLPESTRYTEGINHVT
ncbi:hypothetical protein DACRYDRAFT_117539 [Dacryopinax primogenitus]|uniref:Homeobox domain-containing protein n=1 Tax=Dacryopinax primogenitus (strain DJM 731) TaxID=1858805 RepID=M5G1Y8_DACPD|nr:uncharacterized protein DACRYDRAFT_117539 [Dacryopinax primogenitus]EJT99911.1 hypothetical protein DACRYDRAFT_117539 [Dacryopinax primogenitus]